MILYEHPFNERVRTYLRLEHLFLRFDELITREHAVDHHFALTTLFELVDVGGRADLKTEVLKDLERNRQQFLSFRGNPSVSEAALNEVIAELDTNLELLKSVAGRIGQAVTDNEWLSSLPVQVTPVLPGTVPVLQWLAQERAHLGPTHHP